MNENLTRLKALVSETNQVVENLRIETKEKEDNNQIIRAKKFKEIRDYLLECSEIVKEINKSIKVKINVDIKYLKYPVTTYVQFPVKKIKGRDPITFIGVYSDGRNYDNTLQGYGINENTEWNSEKKKQFFFGFWWEDVDEKAFVDNWNQDEFEKLFAIEVEKAITEIANKANAEYQYVTNNTRLLSED